MNAIRVNDAIAVRRLDSEEELAAVVGPQTLHMTGFHWARAQSVWATSDDAAVALVFARGEDEDADEGWMVVLGGAGDQSIHLVDAVRAEAGDLVAGVTVPRSISLGPALERWRAADGADWDLMVCEVPPPPQKGEPLIGTGLAQVEVQAFLDRVSPHHSLRATDPAAEVWAGIRDGAGGLLAVGALTRRPSGVGYLASIATDPACRGTGYGTAVTAYLARQVFEAGEPYCTLAHYHPNDAARRIYLRVGYRTLAQNHSADFG